MLPRFITKRRAALLVVSISAIALIILAISFISIPGQLKSPERRKWKDDAILAINGLALDKAWLDAEIREVAAHNPATHPTFGRWFSDDLLLFKNGQWMICRNICQKQDLRIRDIFIGYGSDGRWYYSTFHFCVGKCVLAMEPRPQSLSQFVDLYWLSPFDGKSDECLKTTWTGKEPYGSSKLAIKDGSAISTDAVR